MYINECVYVCATMFLYVVFFLAHRLLLFFLLLVKMIICRWNIQVRVLFAFLQRWGRIKTTTYREKEYIDDTLSDFSFFVRIYAYREKIELE